MGDLNRRVEKLRASSAREESKALYGISRPSVRALDKLAEWAHDEVDLDTVVPKDEDEINALALHREVEEVRRLHLEEGWTAQEIASARGIDERAVQVLLPSPKPWGICETDSGRG